MAKLKVYTLRDSKTEVYLPPVCLASRGQAIRTMQDIMKRGDSDVAQHPGDFALFEVGEYDNEFGTLIPAEQNVNLGTVLDLSKV